MLELGEACAWTHPRRITRGICARDAARNWELEYTEMMVEAWFSQGSHSACVFYRKQREVRAVVRGDDFTVLGSRVGLDWLREVIQTSHGGEVHCQIGEKKARSGEDLEQDCDGGERRLGVRGGPEARVDLAEGHGDR